LQYLKYLVLPIVLGIILISCEKDDNSVIDPKLTFPTITGVFVTPGTFDTAAIKTVLVAVVQSEEQVSLVKATVSNPWSSILKEIELKDNGVLPDTTAGDGRYTGRFDSTLSCKLVGSYKVEFIAYNKSGTSSNIVIGNFNVSNSNNNRPSVNYVISPDSLRRPSGTGSDSVNIGFLQAWPTDPEGICDVDRVYFYSFRPDGTPGNNGNPISLLDDGNQVNCDSVAHDGKFSICIKIVNNPFTPGYTGPPQIGNYRFRYFAKDIGGLESDSLVKFINVYP